MSFVNSIKKSSNFPDNQQTVRPTICQTNLIDLDRSNRASFLEFFSTSLFKSWHFCYEFFWGPYCGILRSFVSLKHSIRNFGAFNLGWFSGRSTHHWLSLRIWNSNQWFNSNHYHSVHTFTKIFIFSKREMKISQFRPPFFEQFSLGFSCCIQFWRKFQSRSRSQERDCCINLLLLFYL